MKPQRTIRKFYFAPVVLLALVAAACSPIATDAPTALPATSGAPQAGTEVQFTGLVEAMSPEAWTISGQTARIAPDTQIEDEVKIGDTVEAKALVEADGTLSLSRVKLDDDGVINDNANANGNDDNANGNDDNANGNDDNANGNDDNANGNDDNANGNDDDNDNGNDDDNANDNDDDNANGNDDDNANGNDD